MAPKYSPPPANAILEIPEEDSRVAMRGTEDNSQMDFTFRKPEYNFDQAMSLTKTSAERQKDKNKKSHRNSVDGGAAAKGHTMKGKSKSGSSKRISVSASRDDSASRRRQQIYLTKDDEGSSNSEEDEEDTIENQQQTVAAARGRLTSPSLLSTLTSLTTATNHSNSSSGSNSTVTQSSYTRSSHRTPDTSPISPAVPDAPDVFAYLEKDEDDNEDRGVEVDWSPKSPGSYPEPPLSQHIVIPLNGSVSSSASSSFHSDDGASEKPADNDTDRSTSPERSVKGEDEPIKGEDPSIKPDTSLPTDPSAAKIASQILAAQQRQTMYARHGSRGVSFSSQSPVNQAPRHSPPQQVQQRPRPKTTLPTKTGYEALAAKLSSQDGGDKSIKPMYRKFEALNHRLLLQLQDELAELEEKLRVLDQSDNQARTVVKYPSTDTRILPASRRATANAGGEFEWYKMDLINRISVKLNQYNQALTSFNNMKSSMKSPDSKSINQYRSYLDNEKLIVEAEAKFLTVTDDLVVIDTKKSVHHSSSSLSSSLSSLSSLSAPKDWTLPPLPSLACAVAAAVLIPILTFNVIPGYLGRMTVVLLVALGMVAGLVQAGVAGRDLLGRERIACGLIYGVLMAVIAGVVA